MYNQAYFNTMHTETMKTVQQQPLSQMPLPFKVHDLNYIHHSLGLSYLSAEGIISIAREALVHGHPQCFNCNGQTYVRLEDNQMVFTLSYDYTTVVSIQWTANPNQVMHPKATYLPREQSPIPSTSSMLNLNGKTLEENTPEFHQMIDQIVDDMLEDEFIVNNEVTRHYRNSPAVSVSCISLSPDDSERNLSVPVSSSKAAKAMPGLGAPPPLTCIPSSEEINECFINMHSLTPSVRVTVTDGLYINLCNRFGALWESKAHFTQKIHDIITAQPGHHVIWSGTPFRIWSATPFVVVTEGDGCTLADVFEERVFHSHHQDFLQSLAMRYAQKQAATPVLSSYTSGGSASSGSVNAMAGDKDRRCYHLIYIKPIMERLAKVTGCTNIDESMVMQIVDAAIQHGAKRQISKRTFAFQYQQYTVIMSKSLKTILDVAVNTNPEGGEVVTVHPDVVSILAKKCPALDYFTIQRMAGRAKMTARFSAKKNEYRKQFTYDFAGCRIVFASNHTTIVEMQCVDRSVMSMWTSTPISTH